MNRDSNPWVLPSRVWLLTILVFRKHCYVVVKIYAREDVQTGREIAVLEHLHSVLTASPRVRHIGINNVRTLLDRFEVVHPRTSKNNLCLVFTPLGLSLSDARKLLFGGRLDPGSAKEVLIHILLGLDFLHRKAKLVHAGSSPRSPWVNPRPCQYWLRVR